MEYVPTGSSVREPNDANALTVDDESENSLNALLNFIDVC